MSTSNVASEVDAAVWQALAGASVRIPALSSFVYYFPQGHLEHSQSAAGAIPATSLTYDFKLEKPFVHCQVRSIRFFCHPTTDQTFVKILLQPSLPYGPRSRSNDCFYSNDQNDVVSFVKVLSQSDANHGGGFGVPRDCVDLIFPRLDLLSRPAVQTLTFRDAGNKAWTFRHIYRGMPRRHMLSTGWTKFVNEKRLISGDSVVFMRKRSTNELFIGIRRVNNYSSGGNDRSEVVEAIDKAARGVAFEVVYHPRPGIFNFLVNAEKMEESLRISWSGGKRVMMGLETEDSPSGMNWYHGTITASATPNTGPWRGSPWRTIQVCWDTPERLRGMNKVSPWEIEYLPSLDTHPSKRMRLIMQPLPTTQLSLSMPGHLNYSPSPSSSSSGIHGARRDHNNRLSKNNTGLSLEPVSTVLSIGGPYTVSPGSGHEVGRRNSFRLFGKTIQVSEPSDNPSGSSTRPKSNGAFQLF